MAEFFKEHREEIVGASIWEFNQELYDQAKYEDGYDDGMEKGVEIGWEEGVEVGMQKGREEEHLLNLIDKVCKKLKKGKHTEEIAEALEESVEEIKKIAGAAQKFAPEYPLDKIYEFLRQMENKQTI